MAPVWELVLESARALAQESAQVMGPVLVKVWGLALDLEPEWELESALAL